VAGTGKRGKRNRTLVDMPERDEHGAWQSLSREQLCLAETDKLNLVWRHWHAMSPKMFRSET